MLKKTKICPRCKKDKLLSDYHKDKSRNKQEVQVYCKECQKELQREQRRKYPERINKIQYKWRRNNPDKIKKYKKKYCKQQSRKWHLKKYEDLDFDYLFEKQKGLCAVCGLPETRKQKGKKQELSVDHNHLTNEVRGLLCAKCNIAIGHLNVDTFGILNLQKTIDYLNEYNSFQKTKAS